MWSATATFDVHGTLINVRSDEAAASTAISAALAKYLVARGTAGDQVAGDQVAGDQVAGDQVADDQLAGDQLAGDQLAGDQFTGGGRPSYDVNDTACGKGPPVYVLSYQSRPVLRTRSIARLVTAVASYLGTHIATVADGHLLLECSALVGPSGAALLPAAMSADAMVIERRLAQAGITVVDSPWVEIDVPATELVVRSTALEVDWQAVGAGGRGGEGPTARGGRHPIIWWVAGASEDGASEDGASEDGASEDGASEDGASEDGASEDGVGSRGPELSRSAAVATAIWRVQNRAQIGTATAMGMLAALAGSGQAWSRPTSLVKGRPAQLATTLLSVFGPSVVGPSVVQAARANGEP